MTQELQDALADLVAQMIIDVGKGYDSDGLRKAVIERIDETFVAAYRRRMEMAG